jgi:ABC-type antimicrobial peptide transport system permease subunit
MSSCGATVSSATCATKCAFTSRRVPTIWNEQVVRATKRCGGRGSSSARSIRPREDCRQARGVRLLDELAQDVRYALRLIRKAPGFTAAAVLSLGLGIGANTAIFSLMDAVMLRTLPVVEPHDLRFVGHGRHDRPGTMSNYPLFERYRALASVFGGVTAFTPTVFKMMTAKGLENVTGLWVSGNFHGVLGVPVVLGRGFGADDDRNTASPPVAVISDGFWTRRFGRDPSVLGRTLTINGHIVTIVGVTPAGFSGIVPGSNPDLTLPLFVRALDDPEYLAMHDTWTDLTIVARLNASATENEALAATDAAFQKYMSQPENSWIRKYAPDAYAKAILLPAAKGTFALRRQYETALTVLMGMVAVVLLMQTDEPPSAATVEVRTVQDAVKLAPAIRDVVRTVSQHVVLRYVRTMDQQIDASLVRERLLAMLSSGFALLALVLSAIGLYGVMSYSVSRRAREMGIRMALGAARGSVLWQVMRQAIAVSLAGVIVGVVAALLTTKTLATFLFGLSAHDPLTLGAVCVLLLGTSLTAGVVPARRAASVDPARAIRTE